MMPLTTAYVPRCNGGAEGGSESKSQGKNGDRQQAADDDRLPPDEIGNTAQWVTAHEAAEHVSAPQITGVVTCFRRKIKWEWDAIIEVRSSPCSWM